MLTKKDIYKYQLEEIPLQINKVPVHFRVKRKKVMVRARSASKENKREAGTCISPRACDENKYFSINCSFETQQDNLKHSFNDLSIIEMPSELEESPRKMQVLEKTIICRKYVHSSASKKKSTVNQATVKEIIKKKVVRSSSRLSSRNSKTPKAKHIFLKS